MSDAMGSSPAGSGGTVEHCHQRSWATLPREQRDDIVSQNIRTIVDYGEKSCDEIAAEARKEFARDFPQILSQRMRLSVIRSLGGPSDPEPTEARPKPSNETEKKSVLQSILSLFIG